MTPRVEPAPKGRNKSAQGNALVLYDDFTGAVPTMPSSRHHTEWLSLIEVSGPFLSVPVLDRVFPQGLDPHDPEHARLFKLAFEEWEDDQQGERPRPAIHREWIDFVLRQTLGLPDEVARRGAGRSRRRSGRPSPSTARRFGLTSWCETPRACRTPGRPGCWSRSIPPTQDLEKPIPGRHWKASPATRMMELLHATDVRLGLVTNGEHWMLVDAPKGETTGFASWYATLWIEEPLTLRAFRSLLGVHRFFSVADDETLEAMLAESATQPAGSHRPTGLSGPRGRRGDHPVARPDRPGREGGNCWRASPRPNCTRPP